jgi:hypothetical protein
MVPTCTPPNGGEDASLLKSDIFPSFHLQDSVRMRVDNRMQHNTFTLPSVCHACSPRSNPPCGSYMQYLTRTVMPRLAKDRLWLLTIFHTTEFLSAVAALIAGNIKRLFPELILSEAEVSEEREQSRQHDPFSSHKCRRRHVGHLFLRKKENTITPRSTHQFKLSGVNIYLSQDFKVG